MGLAIGFVSALVTGFVAGVEGLTLTSISPLTILASKAANLRSIARNVSSVFIVNSLRNTM